MFTSTEAMSAPHSFASERETFSHRPTDFQKSERCAAANNL